MKGISCILQEILQAELKQTETLTQLTGNNATHPFIYLHITQNTNTACI